MLRTDKTGSGLERRGDRGLAHLRQGSRREEGRARLLERRGRARPLVDPGLFRDSAAGRLEARPFGVYEPARIPAATVPQEVVLLGGRRSDWIDSVTPRGEVQVEPAAGPAAVAPSGVDPPRADRTRRRRALGRQGRPRESRRLRAQRSGLGLARRIPDDRAPAFPAARARQLRARAAPLSRAAKPQLRRPRTARRRRRRRDAPGRPGEEPRRVAARAGGRRAGVAASLNSALLLSSG